MLHIVDLCLLTKLDGDLSCRLHPAYYVMVHWLANLRRQTRIRKRRWGDDWLLGLHELKPSTHPVLIIIIIIIMMMMMIK